MKTRLSTYVVPLSVCLLLATQAQSQILGDVIGGATTLLEPINSTAGTNSGSLLDSALEPVDLTTSDSPDSSDPLALTDEAISDLLSVDSANGDSSEVSPIEPLSQPLGESLEPLVDTLDSTLDPVTDPIDDTLLAPIVEAIEPVTDPVLETVEPATDPVDGLAEDLTGGSVEDALTTTGDTNTSDGDGVVNDLLGSDTDPSTGTESGETSPIETLSQPLGDSLEPLVEAVDTTLDPVTDPVDETLLAPVLEAAEPVTAPLLDAAEPVTDPVDGLSADLTGGSVEDALTTTGDTNTTDGDGAVNDLLVGGTNDTSMDPESGETSPIEPISAPLGDSLEPLVDTADTALDPLTGPVDAALAPVLDATEPATEPVLTAAEPATDPVDGLTADLTGGSVEDALTTTGDTNTSDGDGVVNDLLGGKTQATTDTESGETSPLEVLTEPAGSSLDSLIDTVDSSLNPITDPIDDAVLAPIIEGLEPVTEPLLQAVEPATDPVDGAVADLTGGSVEDALTSTGDDNTADGDGVVNDLLGGNGSDGSDSSSLSVEPIAEPAGDLLAPLVDSVDETLDPITDPIDAALDPVIETLEPATEPLVEALEPVTGPVDATAEDLTGGNLSDAVTSTGDTNTADGDGAINDILGGGNDSAVDTPLTDITDRVGGALESITEATQPGVDAVADGLAPAIDVVSPVSDVVSEEVSTVSGTVAPAAPRVTNSNDDTVSQPIAYGRGAEDQPALLALADAEFLDYGGCKDGDADGVCDSKDECPETPAGQAVLSSGCHLAIGETLKMQGVYFKTNSDELTSKSIAILDEAARYIVDSSGQRFEISGHTDNRGSARYNRELSQHRAESVVAYLVEKGVPAQQLVAKGYGEDKPIDSNDTPEGMAKNRRVELSPTN